MCDYLFTKTDCRKIVKNILGDQHFSVTKCQIEAIDDQSVIGFLGDYFWLRIQCENPNLLSIRSFRRQFKFFVKTIPLQDEQKRLRVQDLFIKEYNIYTNFFPHLKGPIEWHPKCYLARSDCLVLENIREKGYKNHPYGTTFDRSHMECILLSLAQMHACSLEAELRVVNFEEKYPFIMSEQYVTEESKPIKSELKATKKVILKSAQFMDYHDSVQANFDRITHTIFYLLRTPKQFRNVFSHVDLWGSNVMFKYASKDGQEVPEHAIFLDFQLSRYLPPAIDFLIAIYLNTRRADRDLDFIHYQKFYWGQLQRELQSKNMDVNSLLSWDEFRDSCKHFELLAIIYNCRYTPFSNLELDTLQRMEPNDRQHVCLDGRGEYILKTLEKNPRFRNAVYETIGELLEKYF